MLYVISIFLIICFESKGTFFIWNKQENREKSFRKSYIRRVLYFTSLLYAFSDITFVPLDLPRPTVYPIRIVYELVHFRNDV